MRLFSAGISSTSGKPVECLGMTFPNDEARRDYFLEQLCAKLRDPEFRRIEGFPLGSDEDILALSDPPYYTACPNPFIADFLKRYSKPSVPGPSYTREPFATDVSEGKNDAIYKLHSYHTKVPYKSIMHYIEHFTEPGDVVLDVFCGSGMTAVAASQIGRIAVSCDLSPICTFMTHNYTFDNPLRKLDGIDELIKQLEKKYEDAITTIGHDKRRHRIRFTVWSDVLECPECSKEVLFWGNGVDISTGTMQKIFHCPHCRGEINSLTYTKVHETYFDPNMGKASQRIKRVPVLINYLVGKQGKEKYPDDVDREVEKKYDCFAPSGGRTLRRFIKGDMYRSGYHFGMTHVHHFFDQRTLTIAEDIHRSLHAKYGNYGLFVFSSLLNRLTRMNRFIPFKNGAGVVGPFSGTLYMPPLQVEREPLLYLRDKVKTHRKCAEILGTRLTCTTTQSATDLRQIPDNCIDYVFIDPPFGSNLMYSELNFLWEHWIDVFSNPLEEAIQNENQGKGLEEYRKLMGESFNNIFRVLKPGRWLTVEFHNSNNSVWRALQTSIWEAGFVVADVRMLDKRKITMLQGTHSNIAKQDLVISAYKPGEDIENDFKLTAGSEQGCWGFVRMHLKHLPVFVSKAQQAEVIAERLDYLLFDRMVAFHIQRGYSVPLSTAEFYSGLRQRFPVRNGMYFLPDQIPEYDRKMISADELKQLELFVNDERSAIQWVRKQLGDHPMTSQQLQPLFMREAQQVWEKYEQPLEMRNILEENFVEDKGGIWRLPDVRKESDLEQLRHRGLMKEFRQYLDTHGKLRIVRTEALRAGFKDCWQRQDYSTIVQVGKRTPDAAIQEDSVLLMYYDNAQIRSGE
jgi:ubiquinone/menaquinone biosynthesis C-methylase UbiE